MPKNIKQKVCIAATPHDVFEALMDEKKHAAFSGGPVKVDRSVGGKFDCYDGELLGCGSARLRQGVGRLIAEASACGIRIGFVATSASANVSALLAAAFGGARAAPAAARVCADQVARKKPAPDIYELLLATLRAPAEACVAFEDSRNGVAAAKAAGLFTIATPTLWTAAQNLSAADLLLPSLGEPEQPLERDARASIGGAPFLGLAQLDALRARAALREAGA